MDDQTCTWDNTVSADLDPRVVSKVRYVVKSIYGIHDFFSSYFKGELSAASTLSHSEGTAKYALNNRKTQHELCNDPIDKMTRSA